jgi:hypothetical protein
LTSGVSLGAQGLSLVAEAAKRALDGFAEGTHERSQRNSYPSARRANGMPRCFLAVPDSTFQVGRKLDLEGSPTPTIMKAANAA